jgi:hypothetical protein
MRMDYRDRSPVLVGIGIVLLLVGVAAAFLGPFELYSFHLFSEGGRFHYEGFGFGSFMFANIAVQVGGYYVIAMLLIPLGYGHLKVRRWARTLAETLLWSWLVLGVPLVIVAFFMLTSVKNLFLAAGIIAAVLLVLSYVAVPWLLIRFYRGRNVRLTFEGKDERIYWTERVPVPVLVLCFLYAFYVVALHIPILLNGVVPFFGRFLSGLHGILVLDLSILSLVVLLVGTAGRRTWAWWGGLTLFCLAVISLIVTLVPSNYEDILAAMDFPVREIEFLGGIPAQGTHFAIVIGIPLLLILGALLASRRHFGIDDPAPDGSK